MTTITGDGKNNTLIGTDAADIIDGGLGADTMNGLKGNDTYFVDDSGDTVVELSGQGTDLVISTVTYSLGAQVENLTLAGSTAIDGTGNLLANTIIGNDGDNILDGGDGNDKLVGGAGNDFLLGNAGDDTMTGGAGDDTYYVDSAKDQVVEAAKAGNDQIFSSVSYNIAALANVEALTLVGATDIDGTGNAGDNVIAGSDGSNVLDGGKGADQMSGGKGDDTYLIDNAGDNAIELSGEGSDLVISKVVFGTAFANIENYIFETSLAVNFTGSADDNAITGGSGADQIAGGGGNDHIDGGIGADQLTGGIGDDTYVVDNAADQVNELFNEGIDTVTSSLTITALWANVENAALAGGKANLDITGNGLDNAIRGNAGNNVLDGGIGKDLMLGKGGNDTYIVDDKLDSLFEAANGGIDLVKSSVTWTLGTDFENLLLAGSTAIDGIGNTLANVMTGNDGANKLFGGDGKDAIIGGLGDDILFGEADNDTLTGGDGNDALSGGTGADVMVGGAGNDLYEVDDIHDKVVETIAKSAGGFDTVYSSIDFSLAGLSNVEGITLAKGSSDINATGNAHDNVLTGNNGANVIDGGAGADYMMGNDGDDTFYLDNVNDHVFESLFQGFDSVISTAALAKAFDNVEAYIFNTGQALNFTGGVHDESISGGSGADIIDGNGGSHDVISGNAGNDQITTGSGDDGLNGGTGADKMTGGAGDDTYQVDNVGDTIIEAPGEGYDWAYSATSIGSLWDNVEYVTLTGHGNLNATGNALNNALFGNDGKNVLSGLFGDDLINGGAGNDTLSGGAGIDNFEFQMKGNDGKDTIQDFDRSLDMLIFDGVQDNDGVGGINLADLLLDVISVIDHGFGKDVVVNFDNGSAITFTGVGTGSITDLTNLVDSTAQINTA